MSVVPDDLDRPEPASAPPPAQPEQLDEPAEPDQLDLSADFPVATSAQWRALVAGVLRKSGLPDDVDPVQALTTTTYDGIELRPLYTRADTETLDTGLPGQAPYTRGATEQGATVTGWDVRQRHATTDPAHTHTAVLTDLAGGATSLWLVLGEAGLAVEDLATALEDVYLDLAPIALDAGAQSVAAAEALLHLSAARGVAADEIAGTLGADPIGLRARTGAAADLGTLGALAELAAGYPNLRVATVDATAYHDAGAGDASELAIATAVGVAYLRALTDTGLSVDDALNTLEFRFAVTADQFASIAKLRAARQIWGRVAELCGASEHRRGQRQHAVTSAAMMTRRDPWVNILRTTIACCAAAIGGADAITVLPFDAALGLPDDLAQRIARNTHAILHDESSLARVVDAAGGSWYVESFTAALAATAWDGFTAIERAGGALAALDDGTLTAMIDAARRSRADDIAHRRAPITGVSEYAFPGEAPLRRSAAPPTPTGGPLPALRWAEPFETLRDRADAADKRPTVFLATLGPVAAHSARLGFATNLFQAGGIHVLSGPPEEFAGSGTSVACLCSSDRIYADEADPAIATMASATQVWLAGDPRKSGEHPGVHGYLHTGCDALDVLRSTFDALGVA